MARFELHNECEKELVMTALDKCIWNTLRRKWDWIRSSGEALRG